MGVSLSPSCRLFSMEGNNNMEKRLLNIEEFCQYMGIGKTKARELLRGRNGFGVQIGNRWYADKNKLDKWIDRNAA
jgi:hypothetical protein